MESAWAVLLFALTLVAFSVPLWPSFVELRHKQIQVLHIDRRDDRSSGFAALAALRNSSGGTVFGDLRVTVDTPATVVKCTRDLHVCTGSSIEAASARHIFLESDVTVFGVASATQSLRVQPGCQFRWLDAPQVMFTDRDARLFAPPLAFKAAPLRAGAGSTAKLAKFTRIEGRWQPEPTAVISGNYVVTGDVELLPGCKVMGSIKAYGSVTLGSASVVQGSLFSQGDIELAPSARVEGVVSAARTVTLHRGSVIGREDQLGSLSAQHIKAYAGACVFGSVYARVHGLSST
jgi:cytoskeletal protein CcmA (bactofilin family)